MGVYLSINSDYHHLKHMNSITCEELGHGLPSSSSGETLTMPMSTMDKIELYLDNHDKSICLFLGEGKHKIKKKAEQSACHMSINKLK